MANRFLIVCGGTGYKLLGQRTILGVDAELQIDVSKENISRDFQAKDQASFYVDLDERVGVTTIAFNEMHEEVERGGDRLAKAHASLLVERFPAAQNLEFGLNQSPAVGKAAIFYPGNRLELEQILTKMLDQCGRDIGVSNPVDVWIISSTAGGTGEGTHRFVALTFTKVMKAKYKNTPLSLRFIRVGPLTYRSINHQTTSLNTFFGVAADAAFMFQIAKDFPHVVTKWFYVDMPDVGKGDRAKRVRGEIVDMACKAIMLPDLQEDLEKLLVNNKGAPVVLVRTGFWGKDFGSQQKYFETLKQLLDKLTDLIEPNYGRKYVEWRKDRPPQFLAPDLDHWIQEARSAKNILSRMEKERWQFPRYSLSGIPKNVEAIAPFLSDCKMSLRDVLEVDLDRISAEFRMDELVPVSGGGVQSQSIRLAIPNEDIEENAEWFNQVENAHRVKAWARYLLGMDYKDGSVSSDGLIANLCGQAEKLSSIYHGFDIFSGSESKAKRASALLGNFLRNFVQVDRMLGLERSATRALDKALVEPGAVLKTTRDEYGITKGSNVGVTSTTVVNAAEINHVLDLLSQKNWLYLLRDAVRKGNRQEFREAVLRGATGLTEDGLRYVLGLQPTAEIAEIQNTLRKSIGSMRDDNGKAHEGQWWQSNPPTKVMEYSYRVLPQVDRALQEKLRGQAEKDNIPFRYIFTTFGTIGLYVLAFHGASLNLGTGDQVSAPTFLLKPLIAQVKEALSNWPKEPEPGMINGQLEIVTAGTGGEALYEPALWKAGLDDAEIQKISQYYKLTGGSSGKA